MSAILDEEVLARRIEHGRQMQRRREWRLRLRRRPSL
jgi:hypothetical protein